MLSEKSPRVRIRAERSNDYVATTKDSTTPRVVAVALELLGLREKTLCIKNTSRKMIYSKSYSREVSLITYFLGSSS